MPSDRARPLRPRIRLTQAGHLTIAPDLRPSLRECGSTGSVGYWGSPDWQTDTLLTWDWEHSRHSRTPAGHDFAQVATDQTWDPA